MDQSWTESNVQNAWNSLGTPIQLYANKSYNFRISGVPTCTGPRPNNTNIYKPDPSCQDRQPEIHSTTQMGLLNVTQYNLASQASLLVENISLPTVSQYVMSGGLLSKSSLRSEERLLPNRRGIEISTPLRDRCRCMVVCSIHQPLPTVELCCQVLTCARTPTGCLKDLASVPNPRNTLWPLSKTDADSVTITSFAAAKALPHSASLPPWQTPPNSKNTLLYS